MSKILRLLLLLKKYGNREKLHWLSLQLSAYESFFWQWKEYRRKVVRYKKIRIYVSKKNMIKKSLHKLLEGNNIAQNQKFIFIRKNFFTCLSIALLLSIKLFLYYSLYTFFLCEANHRSINLIELNDHVTLLIIPVIFLVTWIIYTNCKVWSIAWNKPTTQSVNFYSKYAVDYRKLTSGAFLEIVWTLVPAIILIFIAIPSMLQLYSSETYYPEAIAVHVIGHQWFWDLCYPHFLYAFQDAINPAISNAYESFFGTNKVELINTMEKGFVPPLLETEKPFILPIDTPIKFYVTSADVIHSFALPSTAIKIDAIPSRLNAVETWLFRKGLLTGQCSELCGAGHSQMPLHIVSVDSEIFNFN